GDFPELLSARGVIGTKRKGEGVVGAVINRCDGKDSSPTRAQEKRRLSWAVVLPEEVAGSGVVGAQQSSAGATTKSIMGPADKNSSFIGGKACRAQGFGLVGRTTVWLVKASPQSVFPQNASGSGVVGADNQRKQASVTAEKRALTPRRKHASFFH